MTRDSPVGAAARRGLSHSAADMIREAILAGRYPAGASLREVELAALLDVSRGSVRDGLAILESEGLIHRAWHRGTRVIEVTPEDVREVYSVRAALDRLAAMTARRKRTPQDISALTLIVDEMRTALARGAVQRELIALDIQFHDRIYETAANRRLWSAWGAIRSQVQLFQLRRVSEDEGDYRARIVDEHSRLVSLLKSGALAEVGVEAEQHVLDARDALLGEKSALRAP